MGRMNAGKGSRVPGRTWGRIALAFLLLPAQACGVTDPEEALTSCEPRYQRVQQTADSVVAALGLDEAGVQVRVAGRVVCQLTWSLRPDSAVATASAAKLLSATAIMGLVDQGVLALDDRIARWFPEARPEVADIRLWQLLSHTSGLPRFHPCMLAGSFTLQSCALDILDFDPTFTPGTGFAYGGPAFSVAGGMAERAAGKPWAEIFREVLGEPLGLTGTTYGDTQNPMLSEGWVEASMRDYGRVLQMLLDGGLWQGRRVLSEQAVREIRRNRTDGATIVYSPRGDIPYGLGTWLDITDGQGLGTVISSPGIGGYVPLADYGRGAVLLFVTHDRADRVWSGMTAIFRAAREVMDAGS